MSLWGFISGMSPWGIISGLLAIIPVSVIIKWWGDRQTRLRAEAKGSSLTVADGAQDLGDPPIARVRWTELRVKNWVDTAIVIERIKITWPPFATAALVEEMEANPSNEAFKAVFNFPKGRSELRKKFVVRVTWFLKVLPLWMSRLRMKVVAETADARRRRVTLILRSNEVDWSEKPD
jgi:hypothetical protein